MSQAISAVHNGLSKNQAANMYGIPKRTLRRYLEKTEDPKLITLPPLGSFATVFSLQQEEELATYAIQMSECFHGLSSREMRSLAYQMAEKNEIQHPFDKRCKLAGRDWLKSFLRRHKTLTLRTPENTSLARAKGFNRKTTPQFADLLERIYAQHAYPPSRIWNVDETGVSTVQTRNIKVMAKKGQHQVGRLVSAERGVNTTITMAMSASGQFLPPLFIFPSQRMNDALKVGAPPESIFASNPNGWSTMDTFSRWFDHFLLFAHPTAEDPVLLILDGHSSHTKNLEVLEKAKANHVRVLSIPPHTSHKTQPLDVSFMGPFKAYYSKALDSFMKRNNGNPVTVYNVAAIVNEAYTEAATISVARNGFRKTGIYPFSRHVFSDNDFASSDLLKHSNDDNNNVSSLNIEATSTAAYPHFSLDQNQPFNLQQLSCNDTALAIDATTIEPCSVSEDMTTDLNTFYFVDENGNLTSLVVQETDDDNPISSCIEETALEPPNFTDSSMLHQSDTNLTSLFKNNEQPKEDPQPSSSNVFYQTSRINNSHKQKLSDNQENLTPSEHVAQPKRRR
ncbi:uncharacterized protein LOC128741096 [Sabethes cyaneus]|uniref:uncharacterized protein LOC128741096 n=1 Tax=Sabethes cyaneus TaxID=53552 RepID=UPI00237DD83F|nr:uncharacterized protein LOC128741096 [Sabethes cyaneus]